MRTLSQSVSTLLLLAIVSSSLALHKHSDLPTHFSKSLDETEPGYGPCHDALQNAVDEIKLLSPSFKDVKDEYVDEGEAFQESTLNAIHECKKFEMKDIQVLAEDLFGKPKAHNKKCMKKFVPYLVQLYHPGMHKENVHELASHFINFLIPDMGMIIDPSEFEEFGLEDPYMNMGDDHHSKSHKNHHGHHKYGRRLHKLSKHSYDDYGDDDYDFDSDLDYSDHDDNYDDFGYGDDLDSEVTGD